ncbi:hypothetical protein BN871_AV_00280 [Paenibacillus sp. P22]|nr:hypothetical protein BN871_AV_00280 [Paenibacillus sp. P22]
MASSTVNRQEQSRREPFAESMRRDARMGGEQPREMRRLPEAALLGDAGDRPVGREQQQLGSVQPVIEQILLRSAAECLHHAAGDIDGVVAERAGQIGVRDRFPVIFLHIGGSLLGDRGGGCPVDACPAGSLELPQQVEKALLPGPESPLIRACRRLVQHGEGCSGRLAGYACDQLGQPDRMRVMVSDQRGLVPFGRFLPFPLELEMNPVELRLPGACSSPKPGAVGTQKEHLSRLHRPGAVFFCHRESPPPDVNQLEHAQLGPARMLLSRFVGRSPGLDQEGQRRAAEGQQSCIRHFFISPKSLENRQPLPAAAAVGPRLRRICPIGARQSLCIGRSRAPSGGARLPGCIYCSKSIGLHQLSPVFL